MTPSTILEHDGIKQPITEWALDYGITPAIIIGRLERGESITSAITTPMKVGFRGQKLASGDMEAFIARSLRGWKRERRKARRGRHKIGQTYTHDGKTMTIQEWSEVTGLKIVTIRARLYADWSIDKVLSSPAERTVTRPKTKHTRASLARAVGIDPSTVSSRLRRGWQLEDALTIEAGSRMGRFARGRPGVSPDFAPSERTGAGSTLQESTNITFSREA